MTLMLKLKPRSPPSDIVTAARKQSCLTIRDKDMESEEQLLEVTYEGDTDVIIER